MDLVLGVGDIGARILFWNVLDVWWMLEASNLEIERVC